MKKNKRLQTIIDALHDKKIHHLTLLDTRKITACIADYMLIGEGDSEPQMRAAKDSVAQAMKAQFKEKSYGIELGNVREWVLLDYVDIVVHLFHPEARRFYNLEDIWSDAKVLALAEEA